MGTEGEDVVADPSGGLKLRMPMRMGIGTVKAAAWHVSSGSLPATRKAIVRAWILESRRDAAWTGHLQ